MNLLEEFVNYLSEKTALVPGENLFYNSAPDSTDDIVLLQLSPLNIATEAQIDGDINIITATTIASSNSAAYELGTMVYRWLYTDKEDTSDADGLIRLSENLTVATAVYGPPVWVKTDEKDRKYFAFKVRVFSKRII